MCVVPGTHKGPLYDHHADGYFCGAMDPELADAGYAKAVPLMGPAGSMTIHHARLVHGSALNTSGKPRRLLLHEYAAADAWPLMGVANFDEFNSRMVLGRATIEPRLAPAPVRMPLPPAPVQGSIYENQKAAAKRFFATAAE
jgi:phytanoyl-CoA hydroxylase